MCRAESHIVPSTSCCCSISCFRVLRRACICGSPERDGWGRFRACHRGGGWCRKKQGPADGAPRRRERFDGAVVPVHRTTRRDRINECVGTWRVLRRRKRRPWPRTLVHKGTLWLPRRRPGLSLPGVVRGAARGKTSVLTTLRRRGPHIKREAMRRKKRTRGRAKRSDSRGRPRGSAFASSDQPSCGRSRRVGRKSSGTPSRKNRNQASKRKRRSSHCEADSTRTSSGRRRCDALYHKKVPPEPAPKAVELPASRPTKKRLSIAPTSCLSGERASERPRGTGVPPVSQAQDAYDSRGTDYAATDAPGGAQVQGVPKAQQEINEETENDFIFSEVDEKCYKLGRGVRGSRALQQRKGSIEASPRRAPQIVSPDHWKPNGDDGGHPESTGGSTAAEIRGDGGVDGWPGGASGRLVGPEYLTHTGVEACSESGKKQTLNEEPPAAHLRLPPRRGWLRDLPAKGPLPQHGVYIGRSHKGKQGLQEVLDACEQHLSQSQFLVDRLPELSGKRLYCHCKPADPYHADALIRAWVQNVDGPYRTVAPGVGRNLKGSLARLVENDKLSLIGVGFEIKDLVEKDLHCIASVLSTVPLATLAGRRRSEVHSPSAATCVTF